MAESSGFYPNAELFFSPYCEKILHIFYYVVKLINIVPFHHCTTYKSHGQHSVSSHWTAKLKTTWWGKLLVKD